MTANFSQGYALLIGVGADLPITVIDANAIKTILTDPNRAAYPLNQVELLIEEGATRKSILNAFDRLIVKIQKSPNSTVIVYYSGHGGRIERTERSPEYFLVPFGFDGARLEETAISGIEFTSKIEALKPAKLIVLLDCCHAAGMPALKAQPFHFVKSPVPSELLEALGGGTGRVVVASSRENEYSFTGTPYSVFTTCLIEAFEGKGAINKDGYARILDVLIYLFKSVPERTNGKQHPFVKKVLDLEDNFPICYYAGKVNKIFTLAQTDNLLQRRIAPLRNHSDLLCEKLLVLREAKAIETDPADIFKLSKQIEGVESELDDIAQRISDLELHS